jgi:acyl carrier protein
MKEILNFLEVDENSFKNLTKLSELQNFDSIKKMELLLLVEKKIDRVLKPEEMSMLSNRAFLEKLLN